MDRKLVGWGRAVKARNARRGLHVPPLWLFTDAERLADPAAMVARLVPGLCGVVFRHDGVPGRAAMARELARLCRMRRLTLTIAGDPKLAWSLRAGIHRREGAGPRRRCGFVVTSSAHGVSGLVAARRRSATVVFLSPVFATESHPGGKWLGPVRWAAMAARWAGPCLALGGIDGASARRLPRSLCNGAGGIGAWLG